MAVSKCVYPYPVLIIRDAATVEWRPTGESKSYGSSLTKSGRVVIELGEQVPVVADVRLSFYQLEGKPWDWSRARRLADACYASHGAISIEDPMGNVWLDGEQPAEHGRPVKRNAKAALVAALHGLIDQPVIDTADWRNRVAVAYAALQLAA